MRTVPLIGLWTCACCLFSCGPQGTVESDADQPGAPPADSMVGNTWFDHVEDNGRFIEEAGRETVPGDTVPEIIYTDTWSGEGKFVLEVGDSTDEGP